MRRRWPGWLPDKAETGRRSREHGVLVHGACAGATRPTPTECGQDGEQGRGKRSERRGRNNQFCPQGSRARVSDLDPIHEHHTGPQPMRAAPRGRTYDGA